MPQVDMGQGNMLPFPDEFYQHVKQTLAAAGVPDESGQMAAVVFKAAMDDGYKQRVMTAGQSGDPTWGKLAQVVGALDQPEGMTDMHDAAPAMPNMPMPTAPQVARAAAPQASGNMVDILGQRSQPRASTNMNPASLSALQGMYLGGGR